MPRIAAATDDGRTLSPHLGRATHYAVLDVGTDGRVSLVELRPKTVCGPGGGRGSLADHARSILAPIVEDCAVLVAGGMGQPIYQAARAAGLEVIATSETDLLEVARRYAAGTLRHEPQRVHGPGGHAPRP